MPGGNVKVCIYEKELRYLEWLVRQRQDIETGGDLFGLWKDKFNVVVQFLLGPGQNCKRTVSSFHQDVNYLASTGQHLTSSHGLCNIGEWHSHHRIGLASPSAGDRETVWENIGSIAGGRFLVFIANIAGSGDQACVNVGAFIFNRETRKMTRCDFKELPDSSPVRLSSFANIVFKQGAERRTDWGTFCAAKEEKNPSKTIPPAPNHRAAKTDKKRSSVKKKLLGTKRKRAGKSSSYETFCNEQSQSGNDDQNYTPMKSQRDRRSNMAKDTKKPPKSVDQSLRDVTSPFEPERKNSLCSRSCFFRGIIAMLMILIVTGIVIAILISK